MKFKKLHIYLLKIFKEPLLIISILMAVFILAAISLISSPTGLLGNNKATLVLTLNNSDRFFEGGTIEGLTLLDVLNLTTATGAIKFKYAIEKDGKVKVLAINGHIIDGISSNLSVLLNSRAIDTTSLNKIAIGPGDKIEVKAINRQ